MSSDRLPHFLVVGNEKGGAGKTTCAMHVICSLLDHGITVASSDADVRQLSLTQYICNRDNYNKANPDNQVKMPLHFVLKESDIDNIKDKEAQESQFFEKLIKDVQDKVQVVLIDTPGSFSNYSRFAHSFANTVITPINDSFLDLDLIAKINPQNLSVIAPSIYSEMLWKQKMVRMQRTGKSLDWIVLKNRMTSVDSINKQNMSIALENISKRLALKVAPGFSERVIFRELFLQGLTLVDLNKSRRDKSFSISHIAARQELKNFMTYIDIVNKVQ